MLTGPPLKLPPTFPLMGFSISVTLSLYALWARGILAGSSSVASETMNTLTSPLKLLITIYSPPRSSLMSRPRLGFFHPLTTLFSRRCTLIWKCLTTRASSSISVPTAIFIPCFGSNLIIGYQSILLGSSRRRF